MGDGHPDRQEGHEQSHVHRIQSRRSAAPRQFQKRHERGEREKSREDLQMNRRERCEVNGLERKDPRERQSGGLPAGRAGNDQEVKKRHERDERGVDVVEADDSTAHYPINDVVGSHTPGGNTRPVSGPGQYRTDEGST